MDIDTVNIRHLVRHLSEEEYEKIAEVLRRSQELDRQGEDRLRTLEKEINRLKEIAAYPMSSSDEPYFCYLCRQMCGLVMERVEECPSCRRGVCKFCRREDSFDLGLLSPTQLDALRRRQRRGADILWSCTLCYKIKEYKVCSGTWIQEGRPDKQTEINMNDTNLVNMNEQQQTNDSMNNNSELSTANHKSQNSKQLFHDYYSDEDNLSAISEEPLADTTSSKSSNGTLGCLEAHEKYGHLDSPSPHEVSSLTLYIQDTSELKEVEPIITRKIKVRSVKDRVTDYEANQSEVSKQEVDGSNSPTKSLLVKKLTNSSSSTPKSNSIKLLSISSHQKDSNMNVPEHLTSIRKNIISDSQIPSGKRSLEEMNGNDNNNTNHTNNDGDYSLMNGSSTKTNELNGQQMNTDEEDSEEVKFDFFYGGEGKLLIPISQKNKNSNSNSVKYDVSDYMAWEVAEDVARMNQKEEAEDLDRFFSGIIVVDKNQYSFESSDPMIQHYYFNGVRRSYEKRFPFEDGWLNINNDFTSQDGNMKDGNGQVENVKESISMDRLKVKEIKEKKKDEKMKDEKDLKDSSTHSADELKTEEEVKKEQTLDKVNTHDDVKSDLMNVTELKDAKVKVHDDEADEVDFVKYSTDVKNVTSHKKVDLLEKNKDVLVSEVTIHDNLKKDLKMSDDEKHKMDADNDVHSWVNKSDELKSKVNEVDREVIEQKKSGNKYESEDDIDEEELKKFLERINKEISKAVERHETAREELLTQQQLRLDVYVKELNNYIQQSSNESVLDEEEWAEEVEMIQNEEVGELLEDQRLELEELEKVRRSILEHLRMRELNENGNEEVEITFSHDKETSPLKSTIEKNDMDKNEFEELKEFVRSGRLDDYVDEITRKAINKSLNIQEIEADDNEASYPTESQLQLVTSPDVDKFANNLSGLVLEEIKSTDFVEIKGEEQEEEAEKEEESKKTVVEETPVYAEIVSRPKDTTENDHSNKIKKFFNTGEEFDEVSKTTTTFGDDISTVKTTVYKKDDDKCPNVVDSGDVHVTNPWNAFDQKVVKDENTSTQDENDGLKERWSEESAFTSSESPELSTEGETNKIASQMEGLYASKMALAGQIHFGMFYDEKTKVFEIYVHRCKDIIGLGRTNPYVKAYLMPDKTRRGKRKTFPRKNTENPVFNEILKYKIVRSELESRTLSLTVWHNPPFSKNELLGEVVLPLKGVDLVDKEGRWYSIQQGVGSQRWKSILDLNHDSKLELSILYTTKGSQNGDLRVKVVQAMSLTSFREDRLCDAFVECFLHTPLSHDAKAKSTTKKSTRNPEWNQEFCFANVTRDQLSSSKLELTIWTQEGFGDKEFLGGVKLFSDEDSNNPEVELWQTVLNSPNEIVTAVLPLRSTMDESLVDY